ncbi:Nif3-like dinuclear metal center hexameric protein [Sulfuriroseicoccus oceanibius]|uniref:GTP cyclohydrolase 1 type 2 homolog n=1 Tax=Sulfuriroseicoccus oceanibius TaxID=2707525 RepID=A0A7T7F1B3_9BACT|nr:Nif3-like dinuclear metal center hexameric protein [Sulfuriroseicoccus oceanibius]QQL44879.1 Nif3-like dinuclear metal center hexameric protein [Sulfuriroseicoccus oceanibius]
MTSNDGVTALQRAVAMMDAELNVAEVPDYSGAMNGLQLEGKGTVTRIGAAVDASLPVVEKAVASGCDLLLVHHGMFWQGAQPVTGSMFRKLKLAMDAGMAIYSSHIPLDVHPMLGNNECLAKAIGMDSPEPFFPWKGIELGLQQPMEISLDELVARVGDATGAAVHHCPGRADSTVGRVGVITGGAGSEVAAIAAAGVDTFITGEGPHWSYPLAEELGVNLIYAGHYATETFGVRALAKWLANRFGAEHLFLDHPTGL